MLGPLLGLGVGDRDESWHFQRDGEIDRGQGTCPAETALRKDSTATWASLAVTPPAWGVQGT